jgi:hypothetical protein
MNDLLHRHGYLTDASGNQLDDITGDSSLPNIDYGMGLNGGDPVIADASVLVAAVQTGHMSAGAALPGTTVSVSAPIPTSTNLGTHITIVASYDTSVTALNTTDQNNYRAAVQSAIQAFQNLISTPITVTIAFGWGEVAGNTIPKGVSGESSTYQYATTYANLYTQVVAKETTSAVQHAAVASLPTTDPTGGSPFTIATAEATALGFNTSTLPIGGSVGLDSSTTENWAWTQSSVGSSSNDAIGTLEHEISEVLGRSATGGAFNQNNPPARQYTLLDMFRYTAANGSDTNSIGAPAGQRDQPFVSGYVSTAPSYFSYNGSTVTQLFETPTAVANGNDVADWASTVNNDAFGDGPTGQVDLITPTDNQVLQVLGYSLCYCRGTRIATPDGQTAIEALAPGDPVATQGADGIAFVPVKWIGHRRIDLTAHPRPDSVAPVLIQRDAFAANVPYRDLMVSPDHGILVDGTLICARQLVNATTIRFERGLASVEYFHVELDTHAILMAEGLPAESYLDTGNRGFFVNADLPLHLHPDLTSATDCPDRAAGSCVPFVWDEASVRPVWQRLADRAAILGQPVPAADVTSDADLVIVAGGRTLRPLSIRNGHYQFVLRSGVTDVRIVSRAATPAVSRPWLEDRRCLGVYVERVRLNHGSDVLDIPLDHPSLTQGWWAVEREGELLRRWTGGAAVLPLPALDGPAILEIAIAQSCMQYKRAA